MSLALSVGAGTASANLRAFGVIPKVGHPRAVNPGPSAATVKALRVGGAAPAVTCPQLDAKGNPTPSPLCNLIYHNGPVMHTSTTHIIYWQPTGYSYAAGYQSLVQQYLTDVAADSGRATNPYAIDTQYSDTTNGNILYKETYAGALTDTDAFPATSAGCVVPASASLCLTETQEAKEVDAFLKAKSLPRGESDIYFLVLPTKVQTCFDDFSDCGPYGPGKPDANGNTSEYCAYHNDFNFGNGETIWANMPNGVDGGCNVIASPPNNNGADTLISSLSHEHNEAITDPAGNAWYDANTGGENGDKCNNTLGPTIGTTATGGSYDVLINHHPYAIQMEWSNAITGCTMTYGTVAPTASFTFTPAAPKLKDTVTFNAGGSKSNDAGGYIINYSWNYGDGSATATSTSPTATHSFTSAGTYTVTLTVTDDAGQTASVNSTVVVAKRATTLSVDGPAQVANGSPATLTGTLKDDLGKPIAGEAVSFTLGSGANAQACPGGGVTNASGQASCTIASVQQPAGATSVSIGDAFAGDSNYLASAGAGTAALLYYSGRSYALSTGLFGLAPGVFSDTGSVLTSASSVNTASLVSLAVPFVNASVLGAGVTTGSGSSAATAHVASLGINVLGVPAISLGTVSASSTSTCSGATGTAAVSSLVIGGVTFPTVSLPPNTTIDVGVLKVVLNEQIPVAGAAHGLQVNAVHITSPGLLDVVVSSAESDIHNCP